MIYKLTSVKRVIAKVFTDLDLQEGTHRVTDMIEWAGEALEKIGSFPQLTNKVTGKDTIPILELEGYQCLLPTDFHRLIQVAYSDSETGPFYPMRTATGSMEYGSELNTTSSDSLFNVSDSELVILVQRLYDYTYQEALDFINDNPEKADALTQLIDDKRTYKGQTAGTSTTTDLIYHINNNYLKANVEEGYIMMSYQAVPTDAEGYPMIPDVASFQEALYWYINMKLMYPEWKLGRVRDAVYYDARRSWNFYCKQAYGDAMMPDADQMESIKNSWIRLVPNINEHDTFFSTLGEKEVVWNHNRP